MSFMLLAGCGGGPEPGPASAPGEAAVGDGEAAFKFIVCGDPQNNYDVFNRVLEAAKSVDFLIIAGDLTGSGTETEFRSFLDAVDASGVTYYTVPGNHDVATSPVSGNYTRFMGAPYRSFGHKNTHFVLMDNSTPNLGFYEEQRRWARRDLEAARGAGFDHIVAVAHVPPGYPYSARAVKDQIPGLDANREMPSLLEKGGADVLFCGHVHTYLEESSGGLPIVITGGAGAPLLNVGGEAYYHYVLVEIDGKEMTWQPVRI